MKLRYALFCEYAQGDHMGKTNLLGVFASVNVLEVPGLIPPFFFFATFDPEDGLPASLHVRFRIAKDPQNIIIEYIGPFQAPSKPERSDTPWVFNMLLQCAGAVIREDGDYLATLEINGQSFSCPTLHVRKLDASNPVRVAN